jgi:hypothetical protein
LQHPTILNKNHLPALQEGFFLGLDNTPRFEAILANFQAKSPFFVVLTGLEPVTSPM